MPEERIYIPGETYTSVRATPGLVGREDVLAQIGQAIRDTSQSYIIYITGDGGIGKTRLVRHVLEHPPGDMPLVAASDLIDLYRTANRTPEGLADTIQGLLSSDGQHFENYLAAREKLDEYIIRPPDKAVDVLKQREAVLKALVDDLNTLSKDKRIFLVLDTTEKLFFQKDPAAKGLGLAEERPAVLDWLLHNFLPNVHNAVILLAGRPGQGDLGQMLTNLYDDKRFLSINLQGLTESEALDYFDAVVESALASGDPRDAQAAEAIQGWSQGERQTIFYCLCDKGEPPTVRPILLALAIDHLVIEGRPLRTLTRPLAEARALSPEQRREIQDELGRELVRTIREHRRPADELVVALGWLRKGADAGLLAHITELDRKEVEEGLDRIRDLSFVKIRPADDRVFLHDEMYGLLERYALDRVSDAERERVFKTLQAYYDERIDQARDEIADMYRPLAALTLPEPAEVIAARARLQDALVEDLYYRLRWDAVQGFQTYFCRAEEAIAANDESLDMQLRAELLGFLAELDPSGVADEADGLGRADVVADAAVRWIKRLINDERYDRAVEVTQRLRTGAKGMIEAGGELAHAELDIWEALALIYGGTYDRAQKLLFRAEETLNRLRVLRGQRIRWSAILARTYNNLGYLRRVQGQFVGAAEAYKRALPHWRYVKIEAEQGNTLTNFAFALALCGRFAEARRHALDALGLRERLGPRDPVALSCNTLAEIETHAGHYREAKPYAQRALTLSRALGFRRGEGLALLGVAALHRYLSEAPDLLARERKDLLKQALSESRAAVEIFSEEPERRRVKKEPEREIRAYYERGVTFRELSRASHLGEDKENHVGNAEKDLNKARDLARQEELWLPYLDSSLGLAWTYYYAEETVKLKGILQELEEDIQEHFGDYRISPGRFPQIEEDTLVGVFNQLARLYVLKGVQAMDTFEQSDKQLPHPELKEAAREFTLALEYDVLIAEDHQGIRRALNTIHARLKELNTHELTTFYDAVAEAAQKLELPRGECRLWRELEDTFGPYKVFSWLAR